MPGHGPSRRNHQDQDQGQRETLPVFVHINGYLKLVSQPRQPTRSQRRALTRFYSPLNNSKKLHSGGARLLPTEEVCMVVKKVMVTAADF